MHNIVCQWGETYSNMLRLFASVAFTKYKIKFSRFQYAVFKLLSYWFKVKIGFDRKASFARHPMLRPISSTGLFMDWKLQTVFLFDYLLKKQPRCKGSKLQINRPKIRFVHEPLLWKTKIFEERKFCNSVWPQNLCILQKEAIMVDKSSTILLK